MISKNCFSHPHQGFGQSAIQVTDQNVTDCFTESFLPYLIASSLSFIFVQA